MPLVLHILVVSSIGSEPALSFFGRPVVVSLWFIIGDDPSAPMPRPWTSPSTSYAPYNTIITDASTAHCTMHGVLKLIAGSDSEGLGLSATLERGHPKRTFRLSMSNSVLTGSRKMPIPARKRMSALVGIFCRHYFV